MPPTPTEIYHVQITHFELNHVIQSSLRQAKRYTRYNLLVRLYPVYTWYKPRQAKLSNGYQIPDEAPSQTCAPACPAGTCTPSVRKLRPICRAVISDQEMGMLAARAVIGAAAQMTCKDHRLGRGDCAHCTSHKISKKLRCAAHRTALQI